MKKYEFTGEFTECYGVTLYRIRALIDFNDVEKLRTEIERLHEEVHKLRIENMELGLKIKGLSNNENIG